jgi:hypothetical protein
MGEVYGAIECTSAAASGFESSSPERYIHIPKRFQARTLSADVRSSRSVAGTLRAMSFW